jgi:hypothetical protein
MKKHAATATTTAAAALRKSMSTNTMEGNIKYESCTFAVCTEEQANIQIYYLKLDVAATPKGAPLASRVMKINIIDLGTILSL